MKHRTVNAVRVRKAKRNLRPKRLLIEIRSKEYSASDLSWNSTIKGTYVRNRNKQLTPKGK